MPTGPVEKAADLGILFAKNVILEAAFAKAFVALPFLALPIIKQLFTGGVRWFFDSFVFDDIKDRAAMIDIARRKATDRQAFDNTFALAELRAGQPLTQKEKEDEIEKLHVAARRMFHIVPR